MKKQFIFSFIFVITLFTNLYAQILEPVKWSFSSKKINETEAELIFTATIDKGWHLYSQDIPDGGPVATSFSINPSKEFKLTGKVSEPKAISEYDKSFKMVLKYFNNKAVFKQKIKLLVPGAIKITGSLEFMCCDDEKCLPPETVEFEFNIAGNKNATTNLTTTENTVTPKADSASDSTTNADTVKSKFTPAVIQKEAKNDASNLKADMTKEIDSMSLLAFFLLAFGSGLVALLTPCIYPMIPMTMSYFMHHADNRKKSIFQAIIYGLSIIIIYVLVGTVVAVTLGEDFSNWLSTHWIPNIFFFIIFIVFAASFFGMFELTLPSWMINKTDEKADKGGYIGSFFMAFTLVLVSFSCTAPIVGTILALSTQGMVIKPVIGMLGFSLAFALPFTLFAIFPSALNKLPKSGGWLNSVKVVLGFIELALGLKFLSVADQTYHWGLLDREIYIAIWIVIFFLMGLYLLGKLKFSHDSEIKFISVPRLGLSIVTFSFVVYLIPGLFGAPLNALSGWLPPMATHDFDIAGLIRENSNGSGNKTTSIYDQFEQPKYADQGLHLPHGIKGYFDLDQAIRGAKKLNKPIFIDFTGHGCVNCREMEQNVWSDPEVLKRLKEDYIVVALYVDDKKIKLPESEWYTSTYDGKIKKTMSARNSDYQKSKYNSNGQPFYVLVDQNGEMLVKPRGYNLDIAEFVKFLDSGSAEFKKRNNQK